MATQRFLQSILDATKLLSVDIDSITAATTRVLTFPDQNIDFGINGMTTVTPAAGDFIMVRDATDGLLKKVDASSFLAGSSGITFMGNFDASGGVFPGAGAGAVGDLYVVSVAGTIDGVAFSVGDSLYATVANASTGTYAGNWVKIDSTDSVASVFGRTGAVTATAGDYTALQITNTPAGNISAITVQAAIDELDGEKLTNVLASASIFVGSAGNAATAVALSGDGTLSNAGVLTLTAASDTVAGKVELATNAEVATGTDTARSVTPAGLASAYTQTTTLAGTGASQGASLIGIQDVGGFYTATTVEGTLAEIAPKLLSGTAPDWTITNPGASRSFNANAVTMQEIAQSLALLVNDLIARGILQ